MIRKVLQITCVVLMVILSGCESPKSSDSAVGIKEVPIEKVVQADKAPMTDDKIASPATTDRNEPTIIVYYFHRTLRCHTCLTIEADAARAVKDKFGQQIAKENLMWMPFNLDDPGGKEFEKQFDISGSTLVVVKMQDGKVTDFKKLEKVWQLVGDSQAFSAYVVDEINGYLNGK